MQCTTLVALLAACVLLAQPADAEEFLRKRFVYHKRFLLNYLEPREIHNRDTLVVMLHGFPESAYMWETHMEMLRDAGYWPVALHLRGYGFTNSMKREWRKAAADFSPEEISMDVGRLITALGKKNAVLVAHDVGAMLAVSIALRNPSIVKGVMMLSLPVGPLPFLSEAEVEGHISALNLAGLEHVTQYLAGPLVLQEFAHNATGWVAALYNGKGPEVRAVGTPFFTPEVQNNQPVPAFFTQAEFEREVAGLERSGLHEVANFYFQNYGKFFGMMEAFGMKQLSMPYAFVGGEHDPNRLQFGFALKTMVNLPEFRFSVEVPNAGRYVVHEARAVVGVRLLEFLRSLPQE